MLAARAYKGRLLRWLNDAEDVSWAHEPAEFDAAAVSRTIRFLGHFFAPGRPWAATVHGFERLPPPPTLIVSNHSGGTVIPDAWALAWAWYTRFGTGRPLHFLAHEWVLPVRRIGDALGHRGVLWAQHDTALRALTEFRRDVIVFPGGDLDAWRPYGRRYEVEFGGHTGYAKLALEACVPIVPLANAGAHETLRVLTDGRRLARRLGFARALRAHVFPVHLSLPWGLAVGPWPHLPWPAKMRFRFGAPILAPVLAQPGDAVSDEAVRRLDARVQAAVQEQLLALARA